MMLRSLCNEIVRRRLWPIPVLALLVAFAAPVFFLKPAPTGAPAAATAAPAPAAAGNLPARAQRLLAATSPAGSPGGATGSAHDPFQPPASQIAAATKVPGGSASGAGATGKDSSTSASGSGTSSKTTTTSPSATPATSAPSPSPSDTSRPTVSTASVDVRFAAHAGGRVHRAIPRLQPYFIHGKLVAVFVKYSPSRDKAVFAVAPGIAVSGPVKCRRADGVCRYLDIPAGSYARLRTLTKDRILVTRRLDVERIGTGAASTGTTATTAKDQSENACLLKKLRALSIDADPIDRNGCA
jgi:hypothetical protein